MTIFIPSIMSTSPSMANLKPPPLNLTHTRTASPPPLSSTSTSTTTGGSPTTPYYTDTISLPPSYASNAFSDISERLPLRTHADTYTIGPSSSPTASPSWLSCSLLVRSSNHLVFKPKYPRYVGGDDILGSVHLTLDEPRTISSISVRLRGRYTTHSLSNTGGSFGFLDVTEPVWGGGGKKLGVGKHEFAFQFVFPTRVDLKDALALRSENQSWGYTTPHSSVEDSVSVDYSLTVYVQHGRFTRTAR